MHRKLTTVVAAFAGCLVGLPTAQAQDKEFRIGFITTMNNPLGGEQLAGLALGLADVGWKKDGDKLGGVPTRIIYCDDKFQPAAGLECARRLIQQDKVHIVAGVIWSHVLMAIQRQVTRNNVALMSTGAGPAPLAGKRCNRLFVAASNQNDVQSEAMGLALTRDGVTPVYLLAPNYQAGKDMIAGFKRMYTKGKVIGTTLFKTGQTDHQAELGRVRAAQPKGVFLFAPGPMGISFVKQWHAAGLQKKIGLYTVATVDNLSLGAIGKAAVGSYHTNHFDADADNAATKKFVKAFTEKHGRPPTFYAAHTYDAAHMLDAAVKAIGGDVGNAYKLVHALRRTPFDSVRPGFKINVNGYPIQNVYRRKVVELPDGKVAIRTQEVVLKDHKDSYWRQCPQSQRH